MRQWLTMMLIALCLAVGLIGFGSAEEFGTTKSKLTTGIRARFDGDLDLAFFQVYRTIVWDIQVSTEVWAQADVGRNFYRNGWYFQPMVGMNFVRGEDRIVQVGQALAQLTLFHWKPSHLESQMIIGLPARSRQNISLKQIVALPLGKPEFLIGGQVNARATTGSASEIFAGPLFELGVHSARISFTPQFRMGHAESRFLIQTMMFF